MKDNGKIIYVMAQLYPGILQVRRQKEFGIKIPRGGIQADALSAEGENLTEEDLVVDGVLTSLGIEKLKTSMPELDPARITEGFRADDIATLFTVQTFVNITKNLLKEKGTA